MGLALNLVSAQAPAADGGGQARVSGSNWSVSGGEHGLDIRWGGQLVTTYRTDDGPKPYFYPVIGPTGEGLTRGYPMDPKPDEDEDHPHHRSVYFGHRDVNGIDLWSETGLKSNKVRQGTQRQTAVNGMEIRADGVTLRVRNDWLDDQGKKMAEDSRVYGFGRLDNGDITLDWDLTVLATEMDLTFGDDKDGTMGFRAIPGLTLKTKKGKDRQTTGHILTSEGVRDEEAWGKRARWVDYYGLDRKGNAVGIAMFDHPGNLRHPTWWHARDYGLCTANPFGIRHFEKKQEHAGVYTVKKGETLRFRYRLLLHRGEADAKRLDEAWKSWAK